MIRLAQLSYSLSDTASVDGASASVLNGATNITATDDGGSTGSTVDLDNMTSISNTNAITITGDAGINNVEPSTVLSASNKATIDLVSDNAADLLIFNLQTVQAMLNLIMMAQ